MAARPGWMSYDAVSEQYERSTAAFFGALARELVRLVDPAPSSVLIDVGTGAGAAARAASGVVGRSGFVVGVDPSLPMLRLAQRQCTSVTAGATPGLPLRAATADVVLANLVLSHLPRLGAAMNDLVRLLRSGGRLGATAWGEGREPPEDHGTEAHWMVAGVLDQYGLAINPPEPAAPREEWLRDRDRLHQTFASAGLDDVEIEEREYPSTSSSRDFFTALEWGGGARYLRSMADEQTWGKVREAAVAALEDRFPRGIARVALVRFIVGTKARDA